MYNGNCNQGHEEEGFSEEEAADAHDAGQ